MGGVRFLRNDGGIAELELDGLQSRIHGRLLTAREPEYEAARTIWNAMIDRRPAAILECGGARDVIEGVRFAAQHHLLLSIRGGGHNIAGDALCSGGLCLDLSHLRDVRVDLARRVARVSGGARLGDLDAETQAFGLATPVGINSTTGIAGLTLGGGFGWISRKYGLTADNLISADVVTADGQLVRASDEENPDLFWALRGGGGNFGVVTSFEFRLFAVGPEVFGGFIVHELSHAGEVLARLGEVAPEVPDELTCWAVLRKAPPLPFIPAEHHGHEVLILAAVYSGEIAEGERQLEALGSMDRPLAHAFGPMPYRDWQRVLDPLLGPGARNYWKSHNFAALSPALVPVVVDWAGRLPSPQTEFLIAQLGGAMARVAPDATAYPHREAGFLMNVHARWDDPADDRRCVEWAREVFDATAPLATGGVYVNFVSEGDQRLAAAYGANRVRLAELKRRYDPGNLFRINQNIRPEGPAAMVQGAAPATL